MCLNADLYRFFEWDDHKARSNRQKHGVSFRVAMRVFDDPFSFTRQDRIEGGELRWQTTGVVDGTLLKVSHTVQYGEEGGKPYEIVRLINARKADRKERKRYENDQV